MNTFHIYHRECTITL
ncbi:hypothetical protein LINGRAHAP2_LOCUS14478 [Linum grandiflorum]